MQTGRKILNLRCDRRISQQELAKACDITPSALSKIEAGINSPRAHIIWKLAKQLGVTVEYLMDEEMPYPYPGYSYRHEFYAKNQDPKSTVKMEVAREEKAFLEALRQSNHVAREIAVAVPESSVENLRLIHFLIHHTKVKNPSPSFQAQFEKLISSAQKDEAGGKKKPSRKYQA
jgi:transcriptional regulator with XRE-family HTH domain